jgi:hypothetical protein
MGKERLSEGERDMVTGEIRVRMTEGMGGAGRGYI